MQMEHMHMHQMAMQQQEVEEEEAFLLLLAPDNTAPLCRPRLASGPDAEQDR
jgi:hypothetical protein